jgi:iron(III) transport system ATP-binding protein
MRVTLTALRVARADRALLDGVDLELEPGAIHLLAGSSGAGKTTLLRVIAGLDAPDSGTVALDGELATASGEIRIPPHRRGIGMSFQDDALWPHLDAVAHLRFGRRDLAASEIAELLALVGLAGRASSFPGELSGGERQRLGVARALAQRPRLLLLDEPLAHVDLRGRRRLARELVAWLRAHGVGALWVTHHPDELTFIDGPAWLLSGAKLDGPYASRELCALLETDAS